MKRREIILVQLVVYAFVFVLRFLGPDLPYLDWQLQTTIIFNALLIILGSIIAIQLVNAWIRSKTVRTVAASLISVATLLALFFAYHDNLLGLGISVTVIGAIATFVFQAPLLNVVAWVYLHTAGVYGKGDRIKIGDVKGDVAGFDMMQTRLLEVGGEYISSDVSSGRIVTFPNSLLLTQPVLNYTRSFPYLWVDIPFQLAYETDLEFVKAQLAHIVNFYLKDDLERMADVWEKSVKQYGTDIGFTPISFTVSPNQSWVDLRVTFPVNLNKQSGITTKVAEAAIHVFNKYPDRVAFPVGRAR